jgi:hypothetical protein
MPELVALRHSVVPEELEVGELMVWPHEALVIPTRSEALALSRTFIHGLSSTALEQER